MANLQYGNMYKDDVYVKKRFNQYHHLLLPYLKDGVTVLDIGCYMGDFYCILPPGVNYYGIDSDEEALGISRERGAKTFKIDLENQNLPFKSKQFDIILAAEVLEHLKNPGKIVREMEDLLNDDGVILISLPNECTLYHRLKVLFGKGIDGTAFEPGYHLHFPTLHQNDAFIKKHFRIIKKNYWVHADIGGRIGNILKKIPYEFWLALATLNPSLFARV